MNIADYAILLSAVLTVVAVFMSIIRYKVLKFKDWICGEGAISPFVFLIAGCLFIPSAELRTAFLFSVVAGTIAQPVLADPYLIRKTLSYGGNSWKIIETPYWMAVLWGVAMTQLSYFWFRMNDLIIFFKGSSISANDNLLLFIIIGSLYFYIFELIVNNLTPWWKRRNCRQPFGVALYATAAETAMVISLPFFLKFVAEVNYFGVMMIGLIAGSFIALLFVFFCKIFYRRDNRDTG